MAALDEQTLKFFHFKLGKNREDIDCLSRALGQFCRSGKKTDAFSVYYCFCEIFELFGTGYGSMNRLLEFLSDHEFHSGELLTKHRDHYAHSVYVFALGLAVYAGDKSFRRLFLDFYAKEKADDTCFLRWWGLAALFHDIGYPFQLAHEQIKAYARGMWEGDVCPYVSYENMEGILALGENVKKDSPFAAVRTVGEMLAYGINRRLGYPLHILLSLLSERYRSQPDFMDHGYFSAVLLYHQIANSGVSFTEPVADVLTAIALHNNLNRYDIKEEIAADTAIPAAKHPLAYLLVLCDELQDWDRTAFGYVSKKDPLAWKIDLSVSEGNIDVCYAFDGFRVIDTEEREADGQLTVSECTRENGNFRKIASGKFAEEIGKLVSGGIKLNVSAREEKKNKNVSSFASSDSFVNLCDFAQAIHRSYQSVYGGPDFDGLSLEFKLSNIEQAKSYSDKLELVNCFYSEKELDYPVVAGFVRRGENHNADVREDMSFLAREEHLRWVREKLAAGWKYGTDYKTREERDAKKIHKDLVPFDCLPKETQEKDELMIKNMVPFLYHYGHGVRIYSYRGGRKPVLDVAGCGHRTVSDKNGKIKEQIKRILREYQADYRVVVRTNFAFGADQLIAECAIELGITVKAALPLPYEEYIASIKEDAKRYGYAFTREDEFRMRHLLAQTVSCKVIPDEKYTYLEASKYIINKSKKIIALWDGVETVLKDERGNPVNQGGTWHNICIARHSRGLKEEDVRIVKCER